MRRVTAAVVMSLAAGSSASAAQPSADIGPGSVCYEVFVRSFHDSDGDGVGDLRGLIEKLDYINDGDPAGERDLGATCIWLMPVAQSPSYHGYDVTNYYEIERDYGTKEDFRRLVAEAHRRGIRVLVDMVLNHSSAEHPYFKAAVVDRDSPYRDWYVWSPAERPMPGWEAPTWHRIPTREEYYYGLFWSGMPDLNLAHPEVREETRRIARFWLEEMGVDGFRLDAVAHFFEDGGRWRHVEAVHPWLREYAADLREIDPDVFTVGEVWDSTGAILPYYPDQLDAYFIFEVADAIVDAVRGGVKQPLIDAIVRLQRSVPGQRWATFLRNHDQTRTMTELGGDVERAKLAATLLLTLPGIPFVYYGEEIGMTGSKADGDPRLRTPMPWEPGPGAGFTSGVPWEPLQPDSLTANVAAQDRDPDSLLNHYRRLIHLRTRNAALVEGRFVPLHARSEVLLAYLRETKDGAMAVFANLGDAPLRTLDVNAPTGTLAPGQWTAVAVGGGAAGTVTVGEHGSIGAWQPMDELAAYEARLFELRRAN